MKLNSFSLKKLLTQLMSVVVPVHTIFTIPHVMADSIYVTEGVNLNDFYGSSRFNRCAKAAYMDYYSLQREYERTGNLNFLGNLAKYVNPNEYGQIDLTNRASTAELRDTEYMCWAHAAADVIQYWQSYYGVFYQGTRTLPYGFNYSRETLKLTGGGGASKVCTLLTDYWTNEGGNLDEAVAWYFQGDDSEYYNPAVNDGSSNLIATGRGGYSFGGVIKTNVIDFKGNISRRDILNNVAISLGYEQQGTRWIQTEKGKIGWFCIGSYINGEYSGHAITCWGFTLDNEGNLKSLILSDNNEAEYSAREYYLKKGGAGKDSTKWYLYTDEACTKEFYGDLYLDEIRSLKTPETLKNKLNQYVQTSNPLQWTGKVANKEWLLDASENYDTLPDSSSGWKIAVDGNYYPIRYTNGRSVSFGDEAADDNGVVRIYPKGNGSVSQMQFRNQNKYYALFGDNNNLNVSNLSVSSGNAVQFNDINLYTKNATINSGWVTLCPGAKWTGNATVSSNSSLVLYGGEAAHDILTFNDGSCLCVYDDSTLSAEWTELRGNVKFICGSDEYMPMLTLPGGVRWYNNGKFFVEVVGDYPEMEVEYPIVDFGRDIVNWNDIFSSTMGEFSYRNNIVYFTWLPVVNTWNGMGNIWSCTQLGTEQISTNDTRVVFKPSGVKTITISGSVSPYSVSVEGSGNLSFVGANSSSGIVGRASLTKKGSGMLTITTPNNFSGGSTIHSGIVVTKNNKALGSGRINLQGGTLDMNGSALSNSITVQASSYIGNASAYKGYLTLENGTLTGGPIKNSHSFELKSGLIKNTILGNGKVTKSGSGTLTLNGTNNYSGGTTIKGGTVVANNASALGTKTVYLSKGTLNMNNMAVSNPITVSNGTTSILKAGKYTGVLTLNSGALTLSSTGFSASGLNLNGGSLELTAASSVRDMGTIPIRGVLNINGTTMVKIGADLAAGSWALTEFSSMSGNLNYLQLYNPGKRCEYSFSLKNKKLMLNVTRTGDDLYWRGVGTWQQGNSGNWYYGDTNLRQAFINGDQVHFSTGGTVSVPGLIKPGTMKVNGRDNLLLKGNGAIAGASTLTKAGLGKLSLYLSNPDWNGRVYLQGGEISLYKSSSLGRCSIYASGLTSKLSVSSAGMELDKNKSIISLSSGSTLYTEGLVTAKSITLSGNSSWVSSTKNKLDISLGDTLENVQSSVNMYGNLTLENLTLKNSSMVNKGSTAVNVVMGNRAYLSAASLTLGGCISGINLIMSGSKLTQSGSATAINLSGKLAVGSKSTLTVAGAISADILAVTGGSTLNAKYSIARTTNLNKNLEGTNAIINMYGDIKTSNVALKLATLDNIGANPCNFTIANRAYLTDSSLKHKGNITAKNMILSNSTLYHEGENARLQLYEKLALGSKSQLHTTGTIDAVNLIITGGSLLNAQNNLARNICVSSNLQVTNSSMKMYGNLEVGNLVLQNSHMIQRGESEKNVNVKNKITMSDSRLDINGYLKAKAMTLNHSRVFQKESSQGMSVSGNLVMYNGSVLTAKGSLSVGSLTMTGGTLNLNASLDVSNSFTLNKPIDLNLDARLEPNVTYRLIDFSNTNLTGQHNLTYMLGMTGAGCTLTLYSNSIGITVTNMKKWNQYLAESQKAFELAEIEDIGTMGMEPNETENKQIQIPREDIDKGNTDPDKEDAVVASETMDRSGADVLVQSNWGMLNASRAFTDTIGNRAANRRVLGEVQKSAVWMSAMGASTRLSADGVAAGSDYNLYGAAFGMEQHLTEKSSLGLAIGESRGKVSSFTSARTKQDTLHTALYGQHLLQQSTNNALSLDCNAGYGRTESRWQGIEWEQKSVQLDARGTWAHQLNSKTTVSGFAGMQYYASESATVAPGIKSGSVQNLRGEIGVGIGHRATSRTNMYGELSFVGDMVRHNPTASIGEQRVRGANPGRVGLNLSAGVNHALNERWSVNASYNLELQERANSHSANIGAGYEF